MTDMRGSAPTAECQAQWRANTTSEPEPEQIRGATPQPEAIQDANELWIQESFAAALALGALGLYA